MTSKNTSMMPEMLAADLLAARETIERVTRERDQNDRLWRWAEQEVGATRQERDAARAEVERLQPKVCCGKFGEAIPECSNCVPKLRAEAERVAKQRDELVNKLGVIRAHLAGVQDAHLAQWEDVGIGKGSFLCGLLAAAREALAAEQPKTEPR